MPTMELEWGMACREQHESYQAYWKDEHMRDNAGVSISLFTFPRLVTERDGV